MVQINWGILSNAPDPGAAFAQSFQQGRAAGREKATEDALAAYAAAPSQDALRPLAVLAPQAYAALSRNEREAGEAQREQRARAGYSTYLRENAPTPMGMPQIDALAPPAPSQVNGSDEIVVTGRAPAPRPQRTVSIADIAADSPELAQQLTSHVGKMSAEHREDLKDYFGTISSVAAEAKRLPYAQRVAFLDAQRDWLSRYGISSADIDSIDPDDRTLDGLIAIGVGANNVIDNHRADAQFEEAQRRNAQSEARAERNDRRSAYYQERNDRRAQVRFSERGLDRAALASSGNGVRTDLSDLDY